MTKTIKLTKKRARDIVAALLAGAHSGELSRDQAVYARTLAGDLTEALDPAPSVVFELEGEEVPR